MQNYCTLGLVGVFLFLGGCASYSANYIDKDEQVDLYLSTLDDKHFVWCELDLAQCRNDFEKWKLTPRGQAIIREYEKEATGQTYNTHPVPKAFRTRFVNESQLVEEVGEHGVWQDIDQDLEKSDNMVLPIEENSSLGLDGIRMLPEIYGPKVSSDVRTHVDGQSSHE